VIGYCNPQNYGIKPGPPQLATSNILSLPQVRL